MEIWQMRRVPSQVNLEAMKREARDLLHALRKRDAALRRYHSIDPLAGLSQPSLADAKYIIAHEYGYSSWQKLQAHLVVTHNSITFSEAFAPASAHGRKVRRPTEERGCFIARP